MLAGRLQLKVSQVTRSTYWLGPQSYPKAPLRQSLLPSSLTGSLAGLNPRPHGPLHTTAKHMTAGFPQAV